MCVCVCVFWIFSFSFCLVLGLQHCRPQKKKKSCRAAWSILEETFGRMSIKQMRVINPTVLSYKWKEGVLGEKGWERGFWRERVHRGARVDASSHTALNRGSEKKKKSGVSTYSGRTIQRKIFFFLGGGEEEERGGLTAEYARPVVSAEWGGKTMGPLILRSPFYASLTPHFYC